MKQEVILKKGGIVLSRDRDFLVGIATHDETAEFPSEGVPIFYDLDDMNPLPFRLFKGRDGTFYIE